MTGNCFSQQVSETNTAFVFHPLTYLPEYKLSYKLIDKKAESPISLKHFPAYRVPGTFSSFLANKMYFNYFPGIDTLSLVRQVMKLDESDRNALYRLNQQMWELSYHNWQKISKAQLYQVDLEGIIRGTMTKPMW